MAQISFALPVVRLFSDQGDLSGVPIISWIDNAAVTIEGGKRSGSLPKETMWKRGERSCFQAVSKDFITTKTDDQADVLIVGRLRLEPLASSIPRYLEYRRSDLTTLRLTELNVMADWDTNNSWPGRSHPTLNPNLNLKEHTWNSADVTSATGATAGSSSWNAGAEPSSDWDSGTKNINGGSFENAVTETNGGNEESMDNAGAGADDRACRICNETGHLARECPQKPEGFGKCFNCGEEGHSKADCTNAKVFTGTCRVCSKEGHAARDCPDKPPSICRNCKQEGHNLSECTNNMVFDYLANVAVMSEEDAWNHVVSSAKEAVETRDLDEFRDAIKVYQKAVKEVNYEQLERSFRTNDLGIYIIAIEPRDGEILDTHTLVDLSGKKDCKYKVGYFFKKTPKSGKLVDVWPASEDENLARLKDAGVPYERGIPKCLRCKEMGHTAKACTQEETAIEKPPVKCGNCDGEGHRARDCTEARVDRFACRNCKQSGHKADECTEPRSAEGVECKNEEGHISKECDKPKNPANSTCRNCDEVGHFSKDCPQPKNWDKVKCNNCQESKHIWLPSKHLLTATVGHTSKRCPKPIAAEEDSANNGFADGNGGDWGASGGGDAGPGGDSGWDDAGAAVDASSSWGNAPAAPTAIASGGW
ncbi:MAG: hypothetical protein Q9213_006552 [Squamulea squamosa]